jgi:hypothetical protein
MRTLERLAAMRLDVSAQNGTLAERLLGPQKGDGIIAVPRGFIL